MAWNRGDKQKLKPKKCKSHVTLICVVALFSLLCSIIIYFANEPQKESDRQLNSSIKNIGRERVGLKNVKEINRQVDVGTFKTNAYDKNGLNSAKVEKLEFTPKTQLEEDPSEYTATDQMVGALLSTPLGTEPIPFPYSFGNDEGLSDFESGLKKKIVITDKDDANAADVKLALVNAKLEMLDQVQQGETPQQIIENAYNLRIQASKLRQGMIEEMQNWIKESNPGDVAVESALQQFNQQLEKEGIIKINDEELADDE